MIDGQTLSDLWSVWSTRIVVTLGIMVVFELWKLRNSREAAVAVAAHSQSEVQEAAPPVRKVSPPAMSVNDTPLNNSPSRLLREIEENQKMQMKIKCETDASSAGNENAEQKDSTAKSKSRGKLWPSTSKTKRSTASPTTSISHRCAGVSTSTPKPPPMKATTNQHPGLTQFCYWCDVECSLFRVYTLGRHDGVQVAPPYIPHSYRGNVEISLHVTNHTNTLLKVFWVDYKGNHIQKGTLRPNNVWTQTTWIDHPWVFAADDEETRASIPYLYYIPYRVIPTTNDVPTIGDDGNTGLHKFAITSPLQNSPYYCGVQDNVMPFPANFHSSLTAITWTLQHMTRIMQSNIHVVDTLQRYLTNIVEHPEETKYRQIRVASPKFAAIWQSPMRGLLLAVGFVEQGAYAELGCANYPLSREIIQEIALLSYLVNSWKENQNSVAQQPEGADGYGRAGFGRAGTMNM